MSREAASLGAQLWVRKHTIRPGCKGRLGQDGFLPLPGYGCSGLEKVYISKGGKGKPMSYS